MTRKIGLQLYTVREAAKADFVGTLQHVAEIGYRGVETAGNLGGLPIGDLRSILNDLGLELFSGHIPLASIEHGFDELCADYAKLGAKYLGVPWLGPELRTAAGYARVGRLLTAAAAICANHGLTFYYHNHDFEFRHVDGALGFDHLLAAVDASVRIELDVGWVARVGVDPVAHLERLRGRVPLLHIKDVDVSGEDFAIIGEGKLDFGPIMAAGDAVGVDWFVVEQDHTPKGELASVRASYQNLVSRGWLG